MVLNSTNFKQYSENVDMMKHTAENSNLLPALEGNRNYGKNV